MERLNVCAHIPLEPEVFHRLSHISKEEHKKLFEELLPEIIKLGLAAYDAGKPPK